MGLSGKLEGEGSGRREWGREGVCNELSPAGNSR